MCDMFSGFEIKYLNWDTKFFGTKCARIRLIDELTINQYLELTTVIKQYGFVTIDNGWENLKNNEYLSSVEGAFLVDVPLTFSYTLSEIDNHSEGFYNVINNVEQVEKIENIAKNSFLPGRFYNDSRIDKLLADELYGNWIKNSFNSETKYFVIADHVKGFILFSTIDEGRALDIELIAVDDKERKKGIAGKMLETIKYYALKKGYEYIRVVTQAHNIGAVNLYTRQGFKLVKCEYTYHFWNK